MSKIKIYDVDAYLRRETSMTCHAFGQVAVFSGPNGIVVSEREAVHDMFNSVEDCFRFYLNRIPEHGRIALMPTHQADIPVQEIMSNAPSQEMDFYDFFSRRNYNPRCQNNFRFLCGHLREIGYEIPKEPLAAKLQQADARSAAGQRGNRPAPTQERD